MLIGRESSVFRFAFENERKNKKHCGFPLGITLLLISPVGRMKIIIISGYSDWEFLRRETNAFSNLVTLIQIV